MQRTPREDHTIFGFVGELDTLGKTGEDHAVFADDGTATQRRKADVARLACAGVTVAASHRVIVKFDAATFRGRAAEHERGARRRVDLLIVMHLEDLDVERLRARLT